MRTVVTKEQFFKFIEEQDNDRQIRMPQSNDEGQCGCIMVHYGRTQLNLQSFACSWKSWIANTTDRPWAAPATVYAVFEDGFSLIDLIQNQPPRSYGELKLLLHNYRIKNGQEKSN